MIQGIVRRFSKVGWALRLASSSLTSLTTTHGCSDFSRLIIPEPWPVKRFGKRGSLESNPSAPFGRRQTRCSLIEVEFSRVRTGIRLRNVWAPPMGILFFTGHFRISPTILAATERVLIKEGIPMFDCESSTFPRQEERRGVTSEER